METKKEPWFGTLWAEFFISIIGAKLIQAIWLSDVGLVIILPILWLIIHF